MKKLLAILAVLVVAVLTYGWLFEPAPGEECNPRPEDVVRWKIITGSQMKAEYLAGDVRFLCKSGTPLREAIAAIDKMARVSQ